MFNSIAYEWIELYDLLWSMDIFVSNRWILLQEENQTKFVHCFENSASLRIQNNNTK